MSDGTRPVKVATVEGIREEFYRAVTDCFVLGGMARLDGRKEEWTTARGGCYLLVQLACRTGLISPAEGNDWLDALSDRKLWGDVLVKYDPSRTAELKEAGLLPPP